MKVFFPLTNEKLIPKAVYISRQDIVDLAAILENDETLIGARAYFTMLDDHQHTPYEENEVKFLLVPVMEAEGYPNGQDLPFVKGTSDPDSIADSNLYDFTCPCPSMCDTTSVLFS